MAPRFGARRRVTMASLVVRPHYKAAGGKSFAELSITRAMLRHAVNEKHPGAQSSVPVCLHGSSTGRVPHGARKGHSISRLESIVDAPHTRKSIRGAAI